MPSPVDLVIVLLAIVLPLLFVFRESIPGIGGKKRVLPGDDSADKKADSAGAAGGYEGDQRDFVEKMNKLVSSDGTSNGAGTRCQNGSTWAGRPPYWPRLVAVVSWPPC